MILQGTDRIRSYILKHTLKVSWFRQIYTTRSYRLLFFFTLSIIFNLTLALNVPLWVLLVGPILLGIPHLVSTVRYVPQLTSMNRWALPVIGSFFVLIATYRVWFGGDGVSNILEITAGFLALALVGLLGRSDKVQTFGAVILLGGLMAASLYFPLQTLGFLILAHNFVAFFFWMARAKEKIEWQTAAFCLFLFSLTTAGILTGVFDGFMSQKFTEILTNFNESSIGSQIFPDGDITLWSRAVSAYALGQGVHYFVWLKAIPEQELPFEHTTNFSTSFKFLKNEMGHTMIYIAGFILIGLISYALLKNFVEARYIYLSLAAFHGYFEIAALPFVKAKIS